MDLKVETIDGYVQTVLKVSIGMMLRNSVMNVQSSDALIVAVKKLVKFVLQDIW